jgi:hypothetical protein
MPPLKSNSLLKVGCIFFAARALRPPRWQWTM